MTDSPKAVFLSYASQDAEAARRICDALRAAGIEVWFDRSELRGGDAWDQKIRQQISDCALFVPIISANTASRHEGYFRLEWALAEDRSRMIARNRAFIVPVCIDQTPEKASDVPESFQRVQWTRLPSGETPTAFAGRLRQLLSPDQPSGSTGAIASEMEVSHPDVGKPSSQRRSMILPLALTALLVVGVGYFVADKLVLSKRAVAPATAAKTPAVPTANAIPEKSIAVLPFVDMSEKRDQEYFSDGLSEELIDLLSKTPDLRVPARTSSFYFKGKQTTIADIAKALGVAHVLEGSVRKSGKTLRVTAQLVRVADGYHVWSETYDRELKDIFKVQDEIAAAVVTVLKVKLRSLQAFTSQHRTDNLDAYNAFLAARQYFAHQSPASNRRAEKALRNAIELDPGFAAAYAELATVEETTADYGDPATGVARAFAAAEKAIVLAPDLADGYAARGRLRYLHRFDWAGAEADFAKARALDPNLPEVYRRYGGLLASLGRLPEAVAAERRAIELDPLSQLAWAHLAEYLTHSGQFAAAHEAATRALELDPDMPDALLQLCRMELLQGRAHEALAHAQRLAEEDDSLLCTAMTEHSLGHVMESERALRSLIAKYGRREPLAVAEVQAWRGDTDDAFQRLDRAFAQSESGLTSVTYNRVFASLRTDSRYKVLLRKLNLPE